MLGGELAVVQVHAVHGGGHQTEDEDHRGHLRGGCDHYVSSHFHKRLQSVSEPPSGHLAAWQEISATILSTFVNLFLNASQRC